MSEISDNELIVFNQKGLIPGPNEDIEAYLKRVNYCLDLKEHLPDELKNNLSNEQLHDSEILISATKELSKFYDCAPSWILVFFSHYKLPFWHGGCAWIFQIKENSPVSALIQLQKAFSTSKTYLKIYQRQELLIHELCHVGRMMFEEPKFEELIAYRTAKTLYRKWLGPLMQSSFESAIFLLSLFVLVIFDIFLFSSSNPQAYFLGLWLKLLPITMVIFALLRLWNRQKTYKNCLKNLEKCVNKDCVEAVTYRLTDNEVILFAKSEPHKIKEYAGLKMQEELRWRVIFKAYFC